MRIGAVDPGGRTGLVTIELPGYGPFRGNATDAVVLAMREGRLTLQNINGPELDQAWTLYRELRFFDVVVCEDWQIPAKTSNRNRETLSPVRIAFGLELLLAQSRMFEGVFIYQQPTQMGVITDDRLRAWGLWLLGEKNKDIRSALKHLLIYLRGY